MRDVPYSRLMDNSSILPAKLDSDSKLNTIDRSKLIVNIPDADLLPKNSISDSKLAVDYFQSSLSNAIDHSSVSNQILICWHF